MHCWRGPQELHGLQKQAALPGVDGVQKSTAAASTPSVATTLARWNRTVAADAYSKFRTYGSGVLCVTNQDYKSPCSEITKQSTNALMD